MNLIELIKIRRLKKKDAVKYLRKKYRIKSENKVIKNLKKVWRKDE